MEITLSNHLITGEWNQISTAGKPENSQIYGNKNTLSKTANGSKKKSQGKLENTVRQTKTKHSKLI